MTIEQHLDNLKLKHQNTITQRLELIKMRYLKEGKSVIEDFNNDAENVLGDKLARNEVDTLYDIMRSGQAFNSAIILDSLRRIGKDAMENYIKDFHDLVSINSNSSTKI